jgi:hypothetical protein
MRRARSNHPQNPREHGDVVVVASDRVEDVSDLWTPCVRDSAREDAATRGNHQLGRPPASGPTADRSFYIFSPFVLFPIIIFKFKFELDSSLTQISKMH